MHYIIFSWPEMALGKLAEGNGKNQGSLSYYVPSTLHIFSLNVCNTLGERRCNSHFIDLKIQGMVSGSTYPEQVSGKWWPWHSLLCQANVPQSLLFIPPTLSEYLLCARHHSMLHSENTHYRLQFSAFGNEI